MKNSDLACLFRSEMVQVDVCLRPTMVLGLIGDRRKGTRAMLQMISDHQGLTNKIRSKSKVVGWSFHSVKFACLGVSNVV